MSSFACIRKEKKDVDIITRFEKGIVVNYDFYLLDTPLGFHADNDGVIYTRGVIPRTGVVQTSTFLIKASCLGNYAGTATRLGNWQLEDEKKAIFLCIPLMES